MMQLDQEGDIQHPCVPGEDPITKIVSHLKTQAPWKNDCIRWGQDMCQMILKHRVITETKETRRITQITVKGLRSKAEMTRVTDMTINK